MLRTRLSRVLLIFALITGALLMCVGIALAVYRAQTANSGNSAASGSVALVDNDGGGALLSTGALRPGETDEGCIRVTSNGTLPSSVRLYGTTGGSGLDQHVGVTVTRGSFGGSPAFDSCSTFTPDATVYLPGQAAGVIFTGTLEAFPDTWTAGLVDPIAATPESWTNGESHVYRVQVALGPNVAARGGAATQTFHWEARNE